MGLFTALLVLAGILLRWAWVSDMEYKYDEKYMFERSQAVGVTEPWPAVGMHSGAMIGGWEKAQKEPQRILRNPGLSIWFFAGLARVSGAKDPVALTRAVIALNCLALVLLLVFAWRFVPQTERESWSWAAALAAVNPQAIQLQRKIWAQSVLPVFCVVLLMAWFRRHSRIGAFFWGFIGIIIGQIHMSGFFLFAAWVLWTLVFDARRKEVCWGAWGSGAALGLIPMLPWLAYLWDVFSSISGVAVGGGDSAFPLHFSLRFWEIWVLEAVGWMKMEFHLLVPLGQEQFQRFLREPVVGGVPTYISGALHLAMALTGGWLVLQGFWQLARRPRHWFSRFSGSDSDSATVQSATFWGMGVLLSLAAGSAVHRHYLIVAFPLAYLWLSRLALSSPKWGRRQLFALACLQLAISGLFLYHIHIHGGAPGGDYGVAYSAQ